MDVGQGDGTILISPRGETVLSTMAMSETASCPSAIFARSGFRATTVALNLKEKRRHLDDTFELSAIRTAATAQTVITLHVVWSLAREIRDN